MVFLKDVQQKMKSQTVKVRIYCDSFITTHLTMQIYKDRGSENLFYDTVTSLIVKQEALNPQLKTKH